LLSINQIAARVDSLKDRAADRDARAQDVLAVRKGKISSVYPSFFPEGVDANVVANFIDIVARDLSEVMAPLPAVNCSAANQVSDRARSFADKRTRIASNYFAHSDLQVQMYTGADHYITFGFVPFIIELDEDAGLPRIRVESPIGAYPEFDRYGRCIAFAKRYELSIAELVSQFPEYEMQLLGKEGYEQNLSARIDFIRYYDKDQSVIYVPSRSNLILSQAKNPLGKPIPNGAFTEQTLLQQELRTGTRYPESRTGNIDASIITGQGVQALMGGFDTQVKSAQAIFASVLKDVISICFEVDEKYFDFEKTVRGVDAGSPYSIDYKPSKDIKKDYSADVRYGMLAGLNPAQGLIFMLQALGGKLISKDMAMRELPFGINVTQEQEKIEIEDMRTALIASMQAYSQAIPQMAVQGQDPTTIVKKIAEVIKARQKGVTLEDAIEDIFAPELPPAGAEQMVEQTSPAPEASPGGPIPVPAQGQQGAPDIQSLLSSLSASGKGTASARRVIRR